MRESFRDMKQTDIKVCIIRVWVAGTELANMRCLQIEVAEVPETEISHISLNRLLRHLYRVLVSVRNKPVNLCILLRANN